MHTLTHMKSLSGHFVLAMTIVLAAGCGNSPSERFVFECPGKPPYVAIEDPGAGWLNESGQRVFPAQECKRTAAGATNSSK